MTPERMFCFSLSVLILTGILLTGWDQARWFLYVPVLFFFAAGVTGFRPRLSVLRQPAFDRASEKSCCTP